MLKFLYAPATQDLQRSSKLDGEGRASTFNDIWDWKTESKIWEKFEDMERWVMKVCHKTSRET